MNVLIVSFDKNLVKQLKEILKDQNVVDVKNGEEAINTAPPFVDVIVYDAISGSISEEDINNMYRQKFRDARYIILVDDIFPVDMKNISPPNKVKLMRDEAPSKIKDVLLGSLVDISASPQEEPLQEIAQLEEESISLEKLFFGTETVQSFAPLQEIQEEVIPEFAVPEQSMHKKLLIVSFDGNLISKIGSMLPKEAEVIQVANIREVTNKAKDADIIIFDTILGMPARRTLMDMSKEEKFREKPYILLIDELFSVDVEDIPLKRKYKFARESELGRAVEKVFELMKEAPSTAYAPSMEEKVLEEIPLPQEEKSSIAGLLEGIIGVGETEIKEESVIPVEEEVKGIRERSEYIPQPVESTGYAPQPIDLGDLTFTLQETIKNQLSQRNLHLVLSQVIKQEEIKEHISDTLRDMLESLLREQVKSALAEINVAQIIREVAYDVLKERLRELIT